MIQFTSSNRGIAQELNESFDLIDLTSFRPITTLDTIDLMNELDDKYETQRCYAKYNIGEMIPGGSTLLSVLTEYSQTYIRTAVTPLTKSTFIYCLDAAFADFYEHYEGSITLFTMLYKTVILTLDGSLGLFCPVYYGHAFFDLTRFLEAVTISSTFRPLKLIDDKRDPRFWDLIKLALTTKCVVTQFLKHVL